MPHRQVKGIGVRSPKRSPKEGPCPLGVTAGAKSGAGSAPDDPGSSCCIREKEGIKDEWGCVKSRNYCYQERKNNSCVLH